MYHGLWLVLCLLLWVCRADECPRTLDGVINKYELTNDIGRPMVPLPGGTSDCVQWPFVFSVNGTHLVVVDAERYSTFTPIAVIADVVMCNGGTFITIFNRPTGDSRLVKVGVLDRATVRIDNVAVAYPLNFSSHLASVSTIIDCIGVRRTNRTTGTLILPRNSTGNGAVLGICTAPSNILFVVTLDIAMSRIYPRKFTNLQLDEGGDAGSLSSYTVTLIQDPSMSVDVDMVLTAVERNIFIFTTGTFNASSYVNITENSPVAPIGPLRAFLVSTSQGEGSHVQYYRDYQFANPEIATLGSMWIGFAKEDVKCVSPGNLSSGQPFNSTWQCTSNRYCAVQTGSNVLWNFYVPELNAVASPDAFLPVAETYPTTLSTCFNLEVEGRCVTNPESSFPGSRCLGTLYEVTSIGAASDYGIVIVSTPADGETPIRFVTVAVLKDNVATGSLEVNGECVSPTNTSVVGRRVVLGNQTSINVTLFLRPPFEYAIIALRENAAVTSVGGYGEKTITLPYDPSADFSLRVTLATPGGLTNPLPDVALVPQSSLNASIVIHSQPVVDHTTRGCDAAVWSQDALYCIQNDTFVDIFLDPLFDVCGVPPCRRNTTVPSHCRPLSYTLDAFTQRLNVGNCSYAWRQNTWLGESSAAIINQFVSPYDRVSSGSVIFSYLGESKANLEFVRTDDWANQTIPAGLPVCLASAYSDVIVRTGENSLAAYAVFCSGTNTTLGTGYIQHGYRPRNLVYIVHRVNGSIPVGPGPVAWIVRLRDGVMWRMNASNESFYAPLLPRGAGHLPPLRVPDCYTPVQRVAVWTALLCANLAGNRTIIVRDPRVVNPSFPASRVAPYVADVDSPSGWEHQYTFDDPIRSFEGGFVPQGPHFPNSRDPTDVPRGCDRPLRYAQWPHEFCTARSSSDPVILAGIPQDSCTLSSRASNGTSIDWPNVICQSVQTVQYDGFQSQRWFRPLLYKPCSYPLAQWSVHCVQKLSHGMNTAFSYVANLTNQTMYNYSVRFTSVFPVFVTRSSSLTYVGDVVFNTMSMCNRDQLRHACLLDERACLQVDGVPVAVSCDATFWEQTPPEVTAVQGPEWWAQQVSTGNLTWLHPAGIRGTRRGRGIPTVFAGYDVLPDPVPIRGNLFSESANCTEEETLCDDGTLSTSCNVTVHFSRWDGVSEFRQVRRTGCSNATGDLFNRATAAEAISVCGPCWASVSSPFPRVLSRNSTTGVPTVDLLSCACPNCKPSTGDGRPCAVLAPIQCSIADAPVLCGGPASSCSYLCTGGGSTASIQSCAATAGSCVCTVRNASLASRYQCLRAGEVCSPSESLENCGAYAYSCTRYSSSESYGLNEYECVGLPMSERDPFTGLYGVPRGVRDLVLPLNPLYANILPTRATNVTTPPWPTERGRVVHFADVLPHRRGQIAYESSSYEFDANGTGLSAGPLAGFMLLAGDGGTTAAIPTVDRLGQKESKLLSGTISARNLLGRENTTTDVVYPFVQLSNLPHEPLFFDGILNQSTLVTDGYPGLLCDFHFPGDPGCERGSYLDVVRAHLVPGLAFRVGSPAGLAYDVKGLAIGSMYRVLVRMRGAAFSSSGVYNLSSAGQTSVTVVVRVTSTQDNVNIVRPASFSISTTAWTPVSLVVPVTTGSIRIHVEPYVLGEQTIVTDCERRFSATGHPNWFLSAVGCRRVAAVDEQAFRCWIQQRFLESPPSLVPFDANDPALSACGLSFVLPDEVPRFTRRVDRVAYTKLVALEFGAVFPLVVPSSSQHGSWNKSSVVAREDFRSLETSPPPGTTIYRSLDGSRLAFSQGTPRNGVGSSLVFDAIRAGIEWVSILTGTPEVSSSKTDWTLSVWVTNPVGPSTNAVGIALARMSAAASVDFGLFVYRNKLYCGSSRTGTGSGTLSGNGPWGASIDFVRSEYVGKWTHLVCTASANGLRLYINGVSRVASAPRVWPLLPNAEAQEFQIQAEQGPLPVFAFEGIDNVAIYRVSFEPEQVTALYANDFDVDGRSAIAQFPCDGSGFCFTDPSSIADNSSRLISVSVGLGLDASNEHHRALPTRNHTPEEYNTFLTNATVRIGQRTNLSFTHSGALVQLAEEVNLLDCILSALSTGDATSLSVSEADAVPYFTARAKSMDGPHANFSLARSVCISSGPLCAGIVKFSSVAYFAVLRESTATDVTFLPDETATLYPILREISALGTCGLSLLFGGRSAADTAFWRLKALRPLLRPPGAVTVSEGTCTQIYVDRLSDPRDSYGYISVRVKCGSSSTNSRAIIEFDCDTGSPYTVDTLSPGTLPLPSGFPVPRFPALHKIRTGCGGGNASSCNRTIENVVSYVAVDCANNATRINRVTVPCNATLAAEQCPAAHDRCVASCMVIGQSSRFTGCQVRDVCSFDPFVYGRHSAFGQSTCEFRCGAIVDGSCNPRLICPTPSEASSVICETTVSCGQRTNVGESVCTPAQASVCNRNHSECRISCSTGDCAIVPSTCWSDIGVNQTGKCNYSDTAAMCTDHSMGPRHYGMRLWESYGFRASEQVATFSKFIDAYRFCQLQKDSGRCTGITILFPSIFIVGNGTTLYPNSLVHTLSVLDCIALEESASALSYGSRIVAAEPVYKGGVRDDWIRACASTSGCVGFVEDPDAPREARLVVGVTLGSPNLTYSSISHCTTCASRQIRDSSGTLRSYGSATCTCSFSGGAPTTASYFLDPANEDVFLSRMMALSNTSCDCQRPRGSSRNVPCASACGPCSPAETLRYCGVPNQTLPVAATGADQFQTESVCQMCPFMLDPVKNMSFTVRSCPGSYVIRSCSPDESQRYCRGSGCLVACDHETGSCSFWGQCTRQRTCKSHELSLCAVYESSTGGAASERYATTDTYGTLVHKPGHQVHAFTLQHVSGCQATLSQLARGGIRISAASCSYNCTYFDASVGLCSPTPVSTTGQNCTAEEIAVHCGAPGRQVSACYLTTSGIRRCTCHSGWALDPVTRKACTGRVLGPLDGNNTLVRQTLGSFAANATLACHGYLTTTAHEKAVLRCTASDATAPSACIQGPDLLLRSRSLVSIPEDLSTFGAITGRGPVVAPYNGSAYTHQMFSEFEFSVTLWWKRPSSNRTIISTEDSASILKWELRANSSYIRLQVSVEGSANQSLTSLLPPETGDGWHFVVIVGRTALITLGATGRYWIVSMSVDGSPLSTAAVFIRPVLDASATTRFMYGCADASLSPDPSNAADCVQSCALAGYPIAARRPGFCNCLSSYSPEGIGPCNASVSSLAVHGDGLPFGGTETTIVLGAVRRAAIAAWSLRIDEGLGMQFDDLAFYRTLLTDADIQALYSDSLSESTPAPSDTICSALSYACLPNGAEDPQTGLLCGTDLVRYAVSVQEGPLPKQHPISRKRAAVSYASKMPAEKRISLNVTYGGLDAAYEMVVALCGATATAVDVDVPLDANGDPMFSFVTSRSASWLATVCYCEPGWFTELEHFGVVLRDPLGSGPCAWTTRSVPCSANESAAIPWQQILLDCEGFGGFSCRKLFDYNGASWGLIEQPCFGQEGNPRRFPSARCTRQTALTYCPASRVALDGLALDWSCRGDCIYLQNVQPLYAQQSIQVCEPSTINSCVTTFPSGTVIPATGANPVVNPQGTTGVRLLYNVVPVANEKEARAFCGPTALATALTTKRCFVGSGVCYQADKCECVAPGGNVTSGVFNGPCGGSTTSRSTAITNCGLFVLSSDRLNCQNGTCTNETLCDCVEGAGAIIKETPGAITPKSDSCSAFYRPCDGKEHATRLCRAATMRQIDFSACRRACTRSATNASNWDQHCVLDVDSCVPVPGSVPLVTVVGTGGVLYDIPATRSVADSIAETACTCSAALGVGTATSSRTCLTRCSLRAALPLANATSACRTSLSQQLLGLSPPAPGVTPALQGDWGTVAIDPVVRPGSQVECAQLCQYPSELCTLTIFPRVRETSANKSCPFNPSVHVAATACRNTTQEEFAFATRGCGYPPDWGRSFNGSVVRCTCSSGCDGCAGLHPKSYCPSTSYLFTGPVCAQYCPDTEGADQACVIENTATADTSLCSVFDSLGYIVTGCPRGCLSESQLAYLIQRNPEVAAANASEPTKNIAYTQFLRALCTGEIHYATIRNRFSWSVTSCGVKSPIPRTTESLLSGSVTVGPVTYVVGTRCENAAQAAAACGQLSTGCGRQVAGLVDRSTCECAPGARLVLQNSPYNNEVCVGVTDEDVPRATTRNCTAEESLTYCGSSYVQGCNMEMVRSPSPMGTIASEWRETESACRQWEVSLEKMSTLMIASRLVERLRPWNSSASPSRTCRPNEGQLYDDIVIASEYAGAATSDAATFASLIGHREMIHNLGAFGELSRMGGLPTWDIDVRTDWSPGSKVVEANIPLANLTAEMDSYCMKDPLCGFVVATTEGPQRRLTKYMRGWKPRPAHLFVVPARTENQDGKWGLMSFTGQSIVRLRHETSFVSPRRDSIELEGPYLLRPWRFELDLRIYLWSTYGLTKVAAEQAAHEFLVSEAISYNENLLRWARDPNGVYSETFARNGGEADPGGLGILFNTSTCTENQPRSHWDTGAISGVGFCFRMHTVEHLCLASPDCCGFDYYPYLNGGVTYACVPSLIGYPCKEVNRRRRPSSTGDVTYFVDDGFFRERSVYDLPGAGRRFRTVKVRSRVLPSEEKFTLQSLKTTLRAPTFDLSWAPFDQFFANRISAYDPLSTSPGVKYPLTSLSYYATLGFSPTRLCPPTELCVGNDATLINQGFVSRYTVRAGIDNFDLSNPGEMTDGTIASRAMWTIASDTTPSFVRPTPYQPGTSVFGIQRLIETGSTGLFSFGRISWEPTGGGIDRSDPTVGSWDIDTDKTLVPGGNAASERRRRMEEVAIRTNTWDVLSRPSPVHVCALRAPPGIGQGLKAASVSASAIPPGAGNLDWSPICRCYDNYADARPNGQSVYSTKRMRNIVGTATSLDDLRTKMHCGVSFMVSSTNGMFCPSSAKGRTCSGVTACGGVNSTIPSQCAAAVSRAKTELAGLLTVPQDCARPFGRQDALFSASSPVLVKRDIRVLQTALLPYWWMSIRLKEDEAILLDLLSDTGGTTYAYTTRLIGEAIDYLIGQPTLLPVLGKDSVAMKFKGNLLLNGHTYVSTSQSSCGVPPLPGRTSLRMQPGPDETMWNIPTRSILEASVRDISPSATTIPIGPSSSPNKAAKGHISAFHYESCGIYTDIGNVIAKGRVCPRLMHPVRFTNALDARFVFAAPSAAGTTRAREEFVGVCSAIRCGSDQANSACNKPLFCAVNETIDYFRTALMYTRCDPAGVLERISTVPGQLQGGQIDTPCNTSRMEVYDAENTSSIITDRMIVDILRDYDKNTNGLGEACAASLMAHPGTNGYTGTFLKTLVAVCPDAKCRPPTKSYTDNCPIGRKGPACQYFSYGAFEGINNSFTGTNQTEERTRTYGIGHFGTRCASKMVGDSDTPDLGGALDCDDGSDFRAGCINGHYDWSVGACVCDPGWTTIAQAKARNRIGLWETPAVELDSSLNWDDPALWALNPLLQQYYEGKSGLPRGETTANGYYACILPLELDGYAHVNFSCRSAVTPDPIDCWYGIGTCQQCSGRGTCLRNVGCICESGTYGFNCQYLRSSICDLTPTTTGVPLLGAPPGSANRSCSGHGSCTVFESSCNCGAPGVADPSCCTTRASCDCVRRGNYGWGGSNCAQPFVVTKSGTTCLNGGTMVADAPVEFTSKTDVHALEIGHRVWCQCAPGWTGASCELSLCPVGVDGQICSGRGTCVLDAATKAYSCRQPFTTGPYSIGLRNYAYLYGILMCIPPGGFTVENPPHRFRGVACEQDAYRDCAVFTNATGWSVCSPVDSLITRVRQNVGDGCKDITGRPGTFSCDCTIHPVGGNVYSGPRCNLSPCVNPEEPLSTPCTGRANLCQTSGCKCLFPSDTRSDTPISAKELLSGQYCDEVKTVCGVAYRPSTNQTALLNPSLNKFFLQTTTGTREVNEESFHLHACMAPGDRGYGGTFYVGSCARPKPTAPYACYCSNATNAPLCDDNTCRSCWSLTLAPTAAPIVFTAAPVSAPTGTPSRTPTSAPTVNIQGWFLQTTATDPSVIDVAASNRTSALSLAYATGIYVIRGDRGRVFSIQPDPDGLHPNAAYLFEWEPSEELDRLGFTARANGTLEGIPLVSGQAKFTLSATIKNATLPTGVLVRADTVEVVVQVEVVCDIPCGPSGVCVPLSNGSLLSSCSCIGPWKTTNASAPCSTTTCVSPQIPSGLKCVCPTPAFSGDECTTPLCPGSDSISGQVCGASVRTDSVLSDPFSDSASKRCTILSNGTGVCSCSFPYEYRASDRICAPLCNPAQTQAVYPISRTCVCRPGYDPADGCWTPSCSYGGTFTNGTCTCPAPFNAPLGRVCQGGLSSRCQCENCGPNRKLSCRPATFNDTLCENGQSPTCVCQSGYTGTDCQYTSCATMLGATQTDSGCFCRPDDPLHAYGGPFCNISRCGTLGTPAATLLANGTSIFRCSCSNALDPNQNPFCNATCATKAISSNGTCSCGAFRTGPGCSIDLCASRVPATDPEQSEYGRYGTLSADGQTCTCVGAGRFWRGKYCNQTACGFHGRPVPGTDPNNPYRNSITCTCDLGATLNPAAFFPKSTLWGCVPDDCGIGGRIDNVTGACICASGAPASTCIGTLSRTRKSLLYAQL